jgi:radical SAM superfamily enzyme YgiQ (UPF0313 family)
MRQPTACIRPPNEQDSAIVRAVYGCSWSRCRFCGVYDALEVGAADRPLADVLSDIEQARHDRGRNVASVFIGDADPLRMRPDDFIEVLRAVKCAFPDAVRVTCYGRLATAWRRRADLARLCAAGLTRIHAGLETGSEELLRRHRKGISASRAAQASRAITGAGIELSLYVLLGLGGATHEREHVAGTVRVLNEARPEFVRFRRLWIHDRCPLADEVARGLFVPQTPEGTVRESRIIVAGIEFPCELEALHHNVYCPIAGALPRKREAILARLDRFLAQDEDAKSAIYARESVI